jgi:Carbohydrate binding domain
MSRNSSLPLRVAMVVLACGWIIAAAGRSRAAGADNAKNLLGPTNKAESWRLEQHEGGKGSMKIDGEAVAFTVTETDGTEWHVQATRPGLDLKEGKEYALSFKAKANADRPMQVNAMIDQDDWHSIGLSETADLTKEWKDYQYTFKAENVVGMKKNRVTLVLGNEKGTVWVRDMVLVEK